MADPIASERALAYAEPSSYLSRDFSTEHRSFSPAGDPTQYYGPSSRISIPIQNISQAEFIDPTRAYLVFTVVAAPVDAPPAGSSLTDNSAWKNLLPLVGSLQAPGVPLWGCPFFSSCAVQIPGLSIRPFTREARNSQMMIASRLLCSGSHGSWGPRGAQMGKHDFEIKGLPQLAGARSLTDRLEGTMFDANGVVFDSHGTIPVTGGTGTVPNRPGVVTHFPGGLQARVRGGCQGQQYIVPLSAFCHLFNGASALLPLAMFSTGADNMTFTFTTAAIADAVNDIVGREGCTDISAPPSFYIMAPEIRLTTLRISNAALMGEIAMLFAGLAQAPVAMGVQAPMSMVVKSIQYLDATALVAEGGTFQLPITAGQPSVRGLLVRITAARDPGSWGGFLYGKSASSFGLGGGDLDASGVPGATPISMNGTTHANEYLYTPPPALTDFQLKIGSYRVPLDPLNTSISTPPIPGQPITPYFVTSGIANTSQGTIRIPFVQREAARLYESGKHLFTLFPEDTDDFTHAMASQYLRGPGPVDGLVSSQRAWYQSFVNFNWEASSRSCGQLPMGGCATGLYVIPFETFPSVFGSGRADCYANRGIDLRAIAQITLSGRISLDTTQIGTSGTFGVSNGGTQAVADEGVPSVTSWEVRAWLAYDAICTLTPGRIELESQFSLLPTGV